jgi:hypothetical protein
MCIRVTKEFQNMRADNNLKHQIKWGILSKNISYDEILVLIIPYHIYEYSFNNLLTIF